MAIPDHAPDMSAFEAASWREMLTGRRGRLRVYLFELATAVSYFFVGLAFLVDPVDTARRSPVGHHVGPFDEAWSVLYCVGALMVLYGVLRPKIEVRASGLLVLGTGLTMQTIATIAFRLEFRVLSVGVYALACWARAYLLIVFVRRAKRSLA